MTGARRDIAMTDKLLEVSAREFEHAIERLVERKFEIRRALPNHISSTPWTDKPFNPHAPLEQLVELKAREVRALLCQKWFEDEAPKWAQPLPLRYDRMIILLNQFDGTNWRPRLVSEYAQMLRMLGWHFERAQPFEIFSAHVVTGGVPPRKRGRPHKLQGWPPV
jgi:hypothetical protein